MKDALVVLGMHRGGTSSLAGTLVHLGAAPPKTLMPPTEHNALGYFESTPVFELNEAILKSGGSDWSDWRAFNPQWRESAVARSFSESARQTLEDEFGGAPLIMLKDPRISRLAPFWFEALKASGYTPHVLLPIRNPLEVALSLRARDQLPLAHGLLTWLRHSLDAEHASRATPRDVISWRTFLSDWRGTLETSGTRLHLAWPRWSDFSAIEIDGFLSDTLRHQRVDDSNWRTRSEIHEWVRLAYDALEELSRTPNSNSAMETLDRVRIEFDRACVIYGPALAFLQDRLERADSRVGQLDLHVEHLDRTAEAARLEMEALRERIRVLEAELIALTTDRDAIRAHVDKLHAALEAAGANPATFEAESAALAAEIERLTTALQSAGEGIAAAERTRQNAAQQAEEVHLAAVEARLAQEIEARQVLAAALEAARADYSNAQARADAEAEQSAAWIEEISALTRDRDAVHAHALNLQAMLEQMEGDVAAIRSELANAIADRDAARAQAHDVERIFEETRRQNDDANRAAAYEVELTELRAALETKALQEEALKEETRGLRDEIQSLAGGADVLRADHDIAQADLRRMETELSELRAVIAAKSLGEEAGSAEHVRLREEVTVLHAEVAALTADRDAVHAHSLRMERGLSTARSEYVDLERQTTAVQAELERVLALRAASRRRARKLLGSKIAKWLVPDVPPRNPPQDDA
ncbi:hypothetical protein [Roseixanthobacter glucoisosaccharinicivorans]|uniref:hypothetical protein n=1 Tax=Roseixanthobacter glucoisosaccharinicivorans TaxID=3119923 RepID=UPI003727AAAC